MYRRQRNAEEEGGTKEVFLVGGCPHVAHSDLPAIEFKESAKSLYGGKSQKGGK